MWAWPSEAAWAASSTHLPAAPKCSRYLQQERRGQRAVHGKLPGAVISQAYTLEYGEAVVELHDDALQPGETVLLVDDLLATGGTAEAAVKLIRRAGGTVVGCCFIVDLPDLGGRERLTGMGLSVMTLCEFEGD